MYTLYPRKYAALTPEILGAFSAAARRRVADHGLTDRPTVILLVVLMFLLGSGCDRDPLYPWIEDVLGDNSLDSMTKRERLLAAFRAYLRQVIEVIGGGV